MGMRKTMGTREMQERRRGARNGARQESATYRRHGEARPISTAARTRPLADRFALIGVKEHDVEEGIRGGTELQVDPILKQVGKVRLIRAHHSPLERPAVLIERRRVEGLDDAEGKRLRSRRGHEEGAPEGDQRKGATHGISLVVVGGWLCDVVWLQWGSEVGELLSIEP